MLGFFHPKIDAPLTARILQLVGKAVFKSRIDINGKQFILNGDPAKPFPKYPQKGQAVLPAGQPNGDSIAVGDHVVIMNGFADPSVQQPEQFGFFDGR